MTSNKKLLKWALGFGIAAFIGFIMLVAGTQGVAIAGGIIFGISWLATFVLGIIIIVYSQQAPAEIKSLILATGILLLLFPVVGWILAAIALSKMPAAAKPAPEMAANATMPAEQTVAEEPKTIKVEKEKTAVKPIAAKEKTATKTIKAAENTKTTTSKTKTRKL